MPKCPLFSFATHSVCASGGTLPIHLAFVHISCQLVTAYWPLCQDSQFEVDLKSVVMELYLHPDKMARAKRFLHLHLSRSSLSDIV